MITCLKELKLHSFPLSSYISIDFQKISIFRNECWKVATDSPIQFTRANTCAPCFSICISFENVFFYVRSYSSIN